MAQTTLSSVASTLLPPTIVGPIFQKAEETSAVMQLARRVPLSVTANTAIPVPLDVPVAGWVLESGIKPVSTGSVGVKLMSGKKVAMLVPVSQEVVQSNAAGLYDQLVNDLPTAIARAFDHAAIHGKDLATNAAGPFSEYLAMTPNTQALAVGASYPNTAQVAGGIYTDIIKGVQQVQNTPGMEFTGIAADPRFKTDLMLAVDTQGRPLFTSGLQGFSPASGQAVGSGNVLGYPTFFNAGVSGKLYRENATLGYGVNNIQTLTQNSGGSTWSTGTFTLSFGGQTTVAIAYNATAAVIQTALQGLSQLGTDVTVTGNTTTSDPILVTFSGLHGANPQPLITSTLNVGAASTLTATQSTVGLSQDRGLRAIGGDFSQCAYGVGMDISVKVSNQASYIDGGTWHSAFQENLVLLLVEAYYGFVVGNVNGFCSYTTTAHL